MRTVEELENELQRVTAELHEARHQKRLEESVNWLGVRCRVCGTSGDELGTSDFGAKEIPPICFRCMKDVLRYARELPPASEADSESR